MGCERAAGDARSIRPQPERIPFHRPGRGHEGWANAVDSEIGSRDDYFWNSAHVRDIRRDAREWNPDAPRKKGAAILLREFVLQSREALICGRRLFPKAEKNRPRKGRAVCRPALPALFLVRPEKAPLIHTTPWTTFLYTNKDLRPTTRSFQNIPRILGLRLVAPSPRSKRLW